MALKEANNLSGTKLKVGEKLRIPSKEARSAGTTVPTPAQPGGDAARADCTGGATRAGRAAGSAADARVES